MQIGTCTTLYYHKVMIFIQPMIEKNNCNELSMYLNNVHTYLSPVRQAFKTLHLVRNCHFKYFTRTIKMRYENGRALPLYNP